MHTSCIGPVCGARGCRLECKGDEYWQWLSHGVSCAVSIWDAIRPEEIHNALTPNQQSRNGAIYRERKGWGEQPLTSRQCAALV